MSRASENTIVALATPLGMSGIAVVRLSGDRALELAGRISGLPRSRFKNRYSLFSPIRSSGGTEIDRGLITFFKSPQSYTGEDVVEISCHGGTVIPQRIIETCIDFGCRTAQPGEFTRRAFLNGKMDLSQAEAVADVIAAKTTLGQTVSYRILSGQFSHLITDMRDRLLNMVATVEGELDFASHEVPPTAAAEKERLLEALLNTGISLLGTYETGRMVTHGAIVSIIGKPNVGKSSLLNAIISEERVIVTDIPGTTRDAVEVLYQMDGFPIRLIDTAGLGTTRDPIEQRGIEFSREFITKSNLVLWIFDLTDTREGWTRAIKRPFFDAPFIVVLNKADLLQHLPHSPKGYEAVVVSTRDGSGIRELTRKIHRTLVSSGLADNEVLLTNARHKEALEGAMDCLGKAKHLLSQEGEEELVAFEIREALSHLDRILGITTAQDILDNIFSSFCVGK